MSTGGKGDKPRPLSVDRKTFENNWDAIFGDKHNKQDNKESNSSEEQTNSGNSDSVHKEVGS